MDPLRGRFGPSEQRYSRRLDHPHRFLTSPPTTGAPSLAASVVADGFARALLPFSDPLARGRRGDKEPKAAMASD